MCYDTWKEMVTDLSIMNKDMAARMSKLKTEYYDVKRENYDLRMQLVFAKNALRDNRKAVSPNIVDEHDGEYELECGECWMRLEDVWDFCPSCGSWIDRDYPIDPNDDDRAYDAWRDDQPEREIAARKSSDAE